MQTCNDVTPFDFSHDDEETQQLFPQCDTTCNRQLPKRRNFFQQKQQQLTTPFIQRYLNNEMESEEEETSSSESETSSSESESEWEMEEMRSRNVIPGNNTIAMKKQQQQQRKWVKVVKLQGVRPHEVQVLVNTEQHILIVVKKTATYTKRFQEDAMEPMVPAVVRVIPLPRSVCVQKLRVEASPTGRELIVKAPFVVFPLQYQPQQWQQSVPIRIAYKGKGKGKGTNLFGTQLEQYLVNCTSIPLHFPFPCNSQQEPQLQLIRDEETGKLCILLPVDTVGFLPQHIRVRLNDMRNVLIVEAGERALSQQQPQQQQHQLLKYLRREFTLPPHTVNVDKIVFKVQRNGILTVKLPLKKEAMQKVLKTVQQQKQQRQTRFGWEKALRI